MKYISIVFLLALAFFSFINNDKPPIMGGWVACGHIDLSKIDSVRFTKHSNDFNYKTCEENGICKYTVLSLTENYKVNFTSYTGCPDMPIRSAGSTDWIKWELNKDVTELIIETQDRGTIQFKIVKLDAAELILKK